MSATIQDSYLLSTHSVTATGARNSKSKGKGVAFGERPLISASYCASHKHEDGLVTLAVNGDGISVYDLSDLHPVTSHTLGPSTSFWAPPLSLEHSEGGKYYRRTYSIIHSAKDVDSEYTGKTIWSWKEEVGGAVALSQDKKSVTLPHDVSKIFHIHALTSLLLLADDGHLTLVDLDVNIKATFSPQSSWHVLRAFLITKEEAQTLNGGRDATTDVLILVVEGEQSLMVQAIGISESSSFEHYKPTVIPNVFPENFADASFDLSGFLSVLEYNGLWSTFSMRLRGSDVIVQKASDTIQLQGLNFLKKSKVTKETKHGEVSLLSLGSSFVLLASPSSTKEITLLLWDVQYGVLLHSHTIPIPPASEKDSHPLSISLVQCNQTQAILVLSPTISVGSTAQSKASVFVVPYSVPKSSTIAGVFEQAGKANPWLASQKLPVSTLSNTLSEKESKQKGELLSKLEAMVKQGSVAEAESLFFEWMGPRDRKERPRNKMAPPPVTASTMVEEVEGPKNASQEGKGLDHSFVCRLLEIVLHPQGPNLKTYSPKIVRYLLGRHSVSYSMVSSDLFTILMEYDDWDTIVQCLQDVIDIPESAMMKSLLTLIRLHRKQTTENDMEVDQSQTPKRPYIRSFFAHVVEYPTSQDILRAAIREHFADVDDLVVLLGVLAEWIDCYMDRDLQLELGELVKNEKGILSVKSGQKLMRMKGGGRLPNMEHTLNFLQAILDSSFLQLLQNSATHDLLHRISANLAPQVEVNRDLEVLRGPLGPFARAQKKALVEASRGKKREEVDWRKRRKQAQEQAAINLGPYQVEELVF